MATLVAASPAESGEYRIREPTCATRVENTSRRPPPTCVGRSTCSLMLDVPSISSTPTVKVTVSPTVRSSTPGFSRAVPVSGLDVADRFISSVGTDSTPTEAPSRDPRLRPPACTVDGCDR